MSIIIILSLCNSAEGGMPKMNQSSNTTQYYIQQVSDMTALSKQVIRKWEERHEIVQPNRLANGYRIYSEKDVNTLLRVKQLSEQGYSIKQAAELLNEQNNKDAKVIEKESILSYEKLNNHVFQLLERGVQCDEFELNLILQQAYHYYGLDKFLSHVVVPFLREIGLRWAKGEWDEYQESVSSLVIRDYLIQIRRNYRCREDAPLLLGACLPLEMHEVPIHIVLLKCMLRGWKTILIGASPAEGSIESLVKRLKPKRVILSATTTIPFESDPQMIYKLDQFAMENKDIEFYLGGRGAIKYIDNIVSLKAIRVTESIEEVSTINTILT